MTITYTWKVTSVKRKNEGPYQDVVVQVYWTKTGTDEHGHIGTFSGVTPFTAVDIPPEQFIVFEDLTEEIILGWIQNMVVGAYEEYVNSQIKRELDLQHAEEVPVPWSALTIDVQNTNGA